MPKRDGFAARAIRSGARRYPREIAKSVGPVTAPQPNRGEHLRELPDHELAASWLGHASVLTSLGGTTILIDPVLSDRIGFRFGPLVIGPSRLQPAPATPACLPAIDVLLISHAHFDHLDRPTLEALASDQTTVVTAARTRRLIPRRFKSVVELSWDQAVDIGDITIKAIRPAHWGARVGVDRKRGYNSYIIEAAAGTVLFAGDTADTAVYEGLGALDLAVFGIGAYDPWEHHHATPEQVWEMFTRSGAQRLLPVHHSTFELSDEHPDEPMERLLRAAGQSSKRVIHTNPGEIWTP